MRATRRASSGPLPPGPDMGAAETGLSVYELPPGQAICPYHYEYGEDEWLLVLAGRPSVRTPEGTDELEPWDVVFFPKGPDGAHQVMNDADEPGARRDVVDDRHPVGDGLPGQRQDRGLDRDPCGGRDGEALEQRRILGGRDALSGKRQLATMITTSVASASSAAATLRTKTQVGSTPT